MSYLDRIAAGFQTQDDANGAVDPMEGQDVNTQGGLDYAGAENKIGNAASLLMAHGEASRAQANPTPAIGSITTTFNEDGTSTHDLGKVSDQAVEYIQQMMGIAQGTLAAKQGLIDRLSAKRDVLEAHPAIAQIGRVASAAATSYNAPNLRGIGLIHGAGASGQQYFQDTPESLQAQIAGTEASKMRDVAPVETALQAEQRTQAIAGKQKDLEEQRRKRDLETRMSSILTQAANGVQIPPGTATRAAKSFNASDQEAQGYEQQVQDAQTGFAAKKAALDKETAANFEAHEKSLTKWDYLRERQRLQLQQEFGGEKTLVPAINQLRKTEDDYGKLQDAASKGGQNIQQWGSIFNAAGLAGFDGDTEMGALGKRAVAVLSQGKVFVKGEDGTRTAVPINEFLAQATGNVNADGTSKPLTQPEVAKIRTEIQNSFDAYNNFDKQAPQYWAQHEAIRSKLPKEARDIIPSLKPGGFVPKVAVAAPASPASPTPSSAPQATPAQPPAQPPAQAPLPGNRPAPAKIQYKTKDGRFGWDGTGWQPIAAP